MNSANRDQIDACLRVVSNRCRNLRKTIERSKTWQAAAAAGQPLNEEQAESVRGLPRKEALLAELTEILKKQTSVTEQTSDSAAINSATPPDSKRSALRPQKSPANAQLEPDPKPVPGNHVQTDPADLPGQTATSSDVEPNSSSSTPPGDSSSSPPRVVDSSAGDTSIHAAAPEAVTQMIAALELKHTDHLKQTKNDSVRAALNLFHVVDYLRQDGSREALLAYFNSPSVQPKSRRVTSLDIDLLIYFNVMLTSPNGNVPHPEAVNVSTAHCIEFINNSTEEAFQDTSYGTLVDIVNAIATCPILTDRREFIGPSQVEQPNKHVYIHQHTEPGHLIEAASAEGTMP